MGQPWEQRKLGELMEFQNGFNGNHTRYGKGIPLISVMDILDSDPITTYTIRNKADLSSNELQRYLVEYGDVLFQRSSENFEDAGRSNIFIDKEEIATFGGFVIRGKRKADYDPYFMRNLLNPTPV